MIASSLRLSFACVRTAALDARRSERRRKARDATVMERAALFESSGDEDVARKEAVAHALAELPDEQREAVVLKVWGGLTFAEIAQSVGAPLNTVAARYRYGLEKLSGLLAVEDARG